MDVCSHAEDRSAAAARYLAGRLGPAEEEGYARHLFSCPECAAAAEQAVALRAALLTAAPAQVRRRTWSPPGLAAAAAIAAVAVGLALVLPAGRLPSPPATRGAAAELRVEIRAAPGEMTLSWPVQPQADRYTVRIFAADGTLLLWRETTEARCTLLRSELPPAEQGRPLFARVEALSPVGEAVGDSGLQPLELGHAPPGS